MKFLALFGCGAIAAAAGITLPKLDSGRDTPSTVLTRTSSRPNLTGVVGIGGKAKPSAEAPPEFAPTTQEGMGWLNTPPPPDVQTASLKASSGVAFVGIVYPPATAKDEKVSSTMVAMTKPGASSAMLEGMVVVDPQGQKHGVKNGDVITFASGAVGIWKLLDKGGKKVAESKVPLNEKLSGIWKPEAPNLPVVCRPGSAITIPGKFDGDLANTKVSMGEVLAENDRAAVIAINPDAPKGQNSLDVQDGDYHATIPCFLVDLKATGPSQMRVGQPANLTITLGGLGGMTPEQAASMKSMMAVRYNNQTPGVISLGKTQAGTQVADFSKISNGELVYNVGFKAIAPGNFVLNTWLTTAPTSGSLPFCQGFQCCSTACAPCKSSWGFCDDKGRTNCTRIGGKTGAHCAACLGGICNHVGSSACGHWWCACPWGKCAC